MTTLSQLISQTRTRLSGGTYMEQVTELAADVSDTDTVLPLASVDDGLSKGVFELGFEKVRVKSLEGSTATLFSFGRGYDGTTATSHAQGDMVTFNPLMPAAAVLAEINGVLTSLYPRLYGVVAWDTVLDPDTQEEVPLTYSEPFLLPDSAVGVVSVFVEFDGAWHPVKRWRWEPDGGKRLFVPASAGQGVRVVYAVRPGLFSEQDPQGGEDFALTTLLPDRCADLIALGVAARLAPMFDFARLPVAGAEHRADGQAKPAGQGASLARLLTTLFEARVEQEMAALHKEHPIRPHREH